MPTWPIAAGSLVAGFAVADITGVRPLGGAVLAVAVGWCALRWRNEAGGGRAAALVALYGASFVGSHLIADAIGAWPAVLTAATVVGAAAYTAVDATTPRR
jgi:hypothetical protein